MSTYVVVNSKKTPRNIIPSENTYQTKKPKEAIDIIKNICISDKNAEIHIYGGDGSIFEAANAIMLSGAAETATLTVHPFGTGNDFSRSFKNKPTEPKKIDLLKFGEFYSANEVNIGFDCDVVVRTQSVKKLPLLKGSIAYMVGVFITLFRKMGKHFDITVTKEDGSTEVINRKLLLCLCANGGYYGGGFNCAPLALLDDGLIEFLCVEKISRLKFLSFFLGYRKGKHLAPDGTVVKKYSKFLTYMRAKKVSFKNVGKLCADGEIFDFSSLDITLANKALTVSVT